VARLVVEEGPENQEVEVSKLKKYHHLVDQLVNGPVYSRRYGWTLGVNLLPLDQKHCNYNCVYCQLGWNDSNDEVTVADFPSVKEVREALTEYYSDSQRRGLIDRVVISGNGEPTLHPEFSEMIQMILEVNLSHKISMPVVCLTNGSRLHDDKIFNAVSLVDECAVKLDAHGLVVNLPSKNVDSSKKLKAMKALKNLKVQSCFFDGSLSNLNATDVENWVSCVRELSPNGIDLYTLSRITPQRGLVSANQNFMMALKERLESLGMSDITTH